MTWVSNAARMRWAVLPAALLALALPPATAQGQHGGAPRPAAPRYSAPRPQGVPMMPRGGFQQGPGQRPGVGYPGPGARPAYPGGSYPGAPGRSTYPGSAYPGAAYARPSYPGMGRPTYSPPGHLGDWLYQHRNVPVQGQVQMLRNDPAFNRLAPSEQQRVLQQLRQVDRMPAQQRERRLARAEILERMAPQERMRVSRSAQRLETMPPARQTLMKNAFRDLSAVPLNQRQIVLNSSRYQHVFSPQERGILSDLLRAEPYGPPAH